MKLFSPNHVGRLAVLSGGALSLLAAVGCQSSIGGQTLPSAYYLRDDVQYFPAGPEFLLSNQERVLEEYRLEQQAMNQGLQGPTPLP
jgi:hypothetical protein